MVAPLHIYAYHKLTTNNQKSWSLARWNPKTFPKRIEKNRQNTNSLLRPSMHHLGPLWLYPCMPLLEDFRQRNGDFNQGITTSTQSTWHPHFGAFWPARFATAPIAGFKLQKPNKTNTWRPHTPSGWGCTLNLGHHPGQWSKYAHPWEIIYDHT